MEIELREHARAHPDRIAFGVAGGGALRTYAELDRRSARLAGMLRRRGLRPGDVLALCLGNEVAWADVAWAGLRAGLLVAPLPTHLTRGELDRLLRTARASALVAGPPARERLAGLPLPPVTLDVDDLEAAIADHAPIAPEDERLGARLVFSGGTTGLPKVMREPLPAGDPPPIRLKPLFDRIGIGDRSVVLSPGPAYHSAPFGFMSTTQRLGGTALTMARFDAAGCARAVAEHHVSHLHLVPTMLVRLLRLPDAELGPLRRLDAIVLGGGACAPEVKREALDRFGPIVHEHYGASEGYGQTYASPEDARRSPGTVGRAVTGTLHVTDPGTGEELPPGSTGKVWFSGTPQVTYDGDPARTAAARNAQGWSTVGDLGHLTQDGYLHLTGREGDTIITGGVNVAPREVEDVLLAHPAVHDAAVFGLADPEWGEQVVALVETSVAADVLHAHLRHHLSPPKRPRVLRTDVPIPRSPAGKLRAADLRAAYQESLT